MDRSSIQTAGEFKVRNLKIDVSRSVRYVIGALTHSSASAMSTTTLDAHITPSITPLSEPISRAMRTYSISWFARLILVAALAAILTAFIFSATASAQTNSAATGQPTISGSTLVGEELTANTDAISDSDGLTNVSYSYQWIRVDEDTATETDLSGATGSTYTTVGDDVGKHIKVRVAFTDDVGNSEELTSDQSDMIIAVLSFVQHEYSVKEGEYVTVILQASGVPDAPVYLPHQLIHAYGDATYGRVTSSLAAPIPNFGFHNTEFEIVFKAEDDDVYEPDKGNFGVFLLKDDFRNPPGVSLPKGFVLADGNNVDVAVIIAYINIIEDELDPDANNAPSGQPLISGTVQVGQTLTAEIDSVTDDDGVPAESEFSYQWILVDGSDETDIPGATSKTYTVASSDEGKTLKVRTDFTDVVGYEESVTSAETNPVLPEVPGAPSNLSAKGGNAQAKLSWDVPTTGGAPSGYEYRLSEDDGVSWDAWIEITGSDGNTTTYTVMNLTNDAPYTFQVRAINSGGFGAESNNVSVTPAIPDLPGAPQNLQATAGDEQVALSWGLPTTGGDSDGFQYRQSEDDGTNWGEWTAIPGDDNTTSHTVENLTNDTEYSFELRAINSGGAGTEYATVKATPVLPDPPGQPNDLTATPGDTEVTLNWVLPTDGGEPDGYQYRHIRLGDITYIDWQDILGSDGAITSHTVTGLINGQTYTFEVRGVNRGGPGAGSDEFPSARPLPPIPDPPQNLTATSGDAEVTLEWDAPTSGDRLTEYAYRQSEDGGHTWGRWVTITGSDGDTTSHIVTGLTNGTTYTFELLAANLGGDSESSNQASAQPLPPPPGAPQSLVATAGDALATLQWDPPPTGGPVESYQYRHSTDAGTNWIEWQDITGSDANTITHTVSNLTYDVEYTFELRAINMGGAGDSSSRATATPLEPGLRVEFDYSSPARSIAHSGSQDRPKVVIKFNDAIAPFNRDTPSIEVTNGFLLNAYLDDGTSEPNDWILEFLPIAYDDISISFIEDETCDSGGICTTDGDVLAVAPDSPYIIEFDAAPEIVGTYIQGDPGADGEYEAGNRIYAYVRFTKPVIVKGGSPSLDLWVGSERRQANWSGGSGNRELVFSYVIKADDAPISAHSISVAHNSLELGNSTIKSEKGSDASLNFTGTPFVTKVSILEEGSGDTFWTHSSPSESIYVEIEFSETVNVVTSNGTPSITVKADNAEVRAEYSSGSGSDTLTFKYAVAAGDGTGRDGWIGGATIIPDSLAFNGGMILDRSSNDADLKHGGKHPVWEVSPQYAEISIDTFVYAVEGNDSALEFEVTLAEPVSSYVTVSYATSDLTATDGKDYYGTSGTLGFLIGQTSKTIRIYIQDDTETESSETLKLTLSNPSRAAILYGESTAYIFDDD